MLRDAVLIESMLKGGLVDHMTDSELDLTDLPRARAYAQHSAAAGWRLENMWALAWVLGFDPAPSLGGQMDLDVHKQMMFGFMEFPSHTPKWRLEKARPRALADVDAMEDLFYCAHNAVRSAQQGGATVPAGFDPVRDGGAIHERRHALTWALSPGVDWDETDLST
jgi:hypothetical protein